MRKWLAAAALVILAAHGSAQAASINIASSGDISGKKIVTVEGEFVAGDEKSFTSLTIPLDDAVIVFSSSGGNLNAGIQIGKTIRLKQFDTAVLNGQSCASACALAWLGGARRYMEPNAQVGFHAAYTQSGSEKRETGMGNALAGSYLSQLGLPDSAVAYITHAAPDEIQWLSPADAEQYGIPVTVIGGTGKASRFTYATGLDLMGFDLPGMPLGGMSKAACEAECGRTAECKVFTFNSKSSTCFLKSNADLAVRYSPAESGYPGEMEQSIRVSPLSIMQRTDIVGMDYAHRDGMSLEQCLRECDADKGCNAFSYIPAKRQCWLKAVAAKTVHKKGVVSGVK